MRAACLMLCLIVLAGGCARPHVKTSTTSAARLSGLHSYTLEQAIEQTGGLPAAADAIRDQVESLVAQALDGRGLRRAAESEQPDLRVRYWFEAIHPDRERTAFEHYYQTGGGAPYTDSPERMLALDLVPTAGTDPLWQARITGLDAPSPTALSRSVRSGLAEALHSLPPN